MARFSVDAVFKAIDRVSAPVGRMQSRVKRFAMNASASIRRLDRQMSKVTGGIIRGGAAVAKFGGAAAIAGATGLYLALDKVAASADELAKRSRRLQFPIEEMQEWQFVAEQSGISADLFDNSLEKFTKRIGEARSGTGAMVTLLKKQNPELLQQITNTDNAAEALDIYLEAMRGTENQLDRTALATAAFGMKGARFLNITEQSADAVAALRMEQRENGVITEKQAAAAEAYNDAVNSLKRSLFGIMQQVLIPLMPVITENVRAMREWAVANKGLIQSKVAEYFAKIRDFAVDVWNNFETIVKWVKRIGIAFAVFASINALLKTFTAVMTAVNVVMAANPVGLIVIGIAALIAAVSALIIYWDEFVDKFVPEPLLEAWDGVKSFFSSLWGGITAEFDKAMSYITNVIDKVVGIYEKSVGAIQSGIDSVGDFFSFGDDGEETTSGGSSAGATSMISPQERTARMITESRSMERSEVVLRDETGRAEVTRSGTMAPLRIERSGAL